MKDSLGRRLRASVRLTVIMLDGKRAVRRLRTPPHQLLTPEGMDALLDLEVARVEQYFPDREFRLVQLRDGNFNFIEVKTDPVEGEVGGVKTFDSLMFDSPDAAQTA